MEKDNTSMKIIVKKEHEAYGNTQVPEKIIQVPKLKNWFFVYWADGQIEHRDTYLVYKGRAYLERMEKRYTTDFKPKWVPET